MSTTRRSWRRLLLAGPLGLVAALGALGPAHAAPQANQYADAVRELGSYCVAKVCLGLAPADVERHGQHQWRTPPADGDAPRCDATHGAQWRHAEMTLPDGRRLQLGYDIVSGSGTAASRYRLVFVKLMLPGLDESRVDHLRDVLTQRFAPMRKLPDAGDGAALLWLGQSKSGLFRVSVTRHFAPVRAADASAAAMNGLGVQALYTRHDEWLAAQPHCQQRLAAR